MQCSFFNCLNINFNLEKKLKCVFRERAAVYCFHFFKSSSGRCRDAFARLETGLDDFVSLESGDHDVEDPQEDEDAGGDGLDVLGTSQFTSNGRTTAKEQDEDGDQSFDTEHCHGESQAAKNRLRTVKTG